MNEAQVKHFIVMERQKGTTIEELIFILHDNGVPEYEISNYLEISIKYVEEILIDYIPKMPYLQPLIPLHLLIIT